MYLEINRVCYVFKSDVPSSQEVCFSIKFYVLCAMWSSSMYYMFKSIVSVTAHENVSGICNCKSLYSTIPNKIFFNTKERGYSSSFHWLVHILKQWCPDYGTRAISCPKYYTSGHSKFLPTFHNEDAEFRFHSTRIWCGPWNACWKCEMPLSPPG